MVSSERAEIVRREARVSAALASAIGLVLLSGCVADGPVFAPMALSVAPADEGGAKLAASDPEDASAGRISTPKAARLAVAAKSARLARNEEEGGESAAVAEAAARNGAAVAAIAVPASAPATRASVVPDIQEASLGSSISGSNAIDRLIEKHAAANGIPAALAYAVVRVESRYNPKARGAGVYGLSQIMPSTARSLGFSGPTAALYDADTNLTYGMRYLKGAWEQGGHDVCRAAMKYKGGHRTTRMSASAARYCSAVKAHMAEVAELRGTPAQTPSREPKKSIVETVVAAITPEPTPPTQKSAKVRGMLTQARGALVPTGPSPSAPETAPVVAAAAYAPAPAKLVTISPESAASLAAAAVPAPRPSVPAGVGIPAAPAGEDVLAERLGGFGDAATPGNGSPGFAAN